MTRTLNRMRDLRGQLDAVAKRAKASEGGEELAGEVETLRDKVLEIEKTMQVPDLRAGWGDSIRMPPIFRPSA